MPKTLSSSLDIDKNVISYGYTIRVVPLENNKVNALYDSGKAEYEVSEIDNKEKKRKE